MKQNLLEMSLQELEGFFADLSLEPYRAEQVFQWIHQKGISEFTQMTNLSKSLQKTF